MPLGHYTKPQVRQLAQDFDFIRHLNPTPKDFVLLGPDHSKFRHFLDEFIPPKPGNIITEDGKIWGTHKGLWHTIGQKLGDINALKVTHSIKVFGLVSEKRIDTNELVIVRGGNNEKLFKLILKVCDWEWLGDGELAATSDNLHIQFRSWQEPCLPFEV